ncbi:hypothetical protein [Sellimonas intestinalis]|uniref:hypothetical protein n=1 Tax=Sellimonas intestinalis TaxID=1653434 RepID=UPI003991ABEF
MKRKHRNVRRTDNQTVTKRISKKHTITLGTGFPVLSLFGGETFLRNTFKRRKKTVMIKDDEKRKKESL